MSTPTTGPPAGQSQSQKENNRNLSNTNTLRDPFRKKFVGGNTSLTRRIFDISSKDAVYQFSETVKAIADYVGQEYTHGGDI
jgi:hypothetical protein